MSGAVVDTRVKRVVTGYRPTGPLHVGHWAGNVENMLALQADSAYECYFFIADWHMLTTHYDRTDELPGFIEGVVLDWLAAGLDPERAVIYRQSDLPEVAEMALLLGMMTPLGWLERVPSFKERLRDMAERDIANYGLLGYPLLQTVDIAIVRGELVPVGEDQVAHLELSREIVRRFNRLYGETLVEPQPLLSAAPLIPGSDGRKMSKSLDNTIGIRDDEAAVRASVRSFLTDPQKLRKGDPGRPEICPVFALHTTFSPEQVERIDATCRTGELGCVDCKTILADNLVRQFAPFRERRAALAAKPGLVTELLAAGAADGPSDRSRRRWRRCGPPCTSDEAMTEDATTAETAATGYAVDVPGFQGPFRLLADLILEQKVDVCDVPIAVGDRRVPALHVRCRQLEPRGGDVVPRDLRGAARAQGRSADASPHRARRGGSRSAPRPTSPSPDRSSCARSARSRSSWRAGSRTRPATSPATWGRDPSTRTCIRIRWRR